MNSTCARMKLNAPGMKLMFVRTNNAYDYYETEHAQYNCSRARHDIEPNHANNMRARHDTEHAHANIICARDVTTRALNN